MATKKTSAAKKTGSKKTAGTSVKKPALKIKAKTRTAAGTASKTPKKVKTVKTVKTVQKVKTLKTSSGKKPLTAREKGLQEIRRKLIRQKEALLSEAETAMNALPEQTIFPDLGDQASAETDMNFLLRLKGREQRLLKKIDLAVERIENGTFGICEVCGEEIGIKRLEARPVTTMCISCKTEQEEEEKLAGL